MLENRYYHPPNTVEIIATQNRDTYSGLYNSE